MPYMYKAVHGTYRLTRISKDFVKNSKAEFESNGLFAVLTLNSKIKAATFVLPKVPKLFADTTKNFQFLLTYGKKNMILNAEEYQEYEIKNLGGPDLSEPDDNSLPISDIVLNNVVISEPYDKNWSLIHLPDGREGYLKSKSLRYFNTKSQNNIRSGDIISDAKRMMGTPYLWGGNSTKGNDCSGFTQTVFKANNIQIPRDARQQALIGTPILPSKDWSNIGANCKKKSFILSAKRL